MSPEFQDQNGTYLDYGSADLPTGAPQHQQRNLTHPSGPSVIARQNDFELLENLKKKIKEGQHDRFRATPQIDVLRSLFMGPNTHPLGMPDPPPQGVSDDSCAQASRGSISQDTTKAIVPPGLQPGTPTSVTVDLSKNASGASPIAVISGNQPHSLDCTPPPPPSGNEQMSVVRDKDQDRDSEGILSRQWAERDRRESYHTRDASRPEARKIPDQPYYEAFSPGDVRFPGLELVDKMDVDVTEAPGPPGRPPQLLDRSSLGDRLTPRGQPVPDDRTRRSPPVERRASLSSLSESRSTRPFNPAHSTEDSSNRLPLDERGHRPIAPPLTPDQRPRATIPLESRIGPSPRSLNDRMAPPFGSRNVIGWHPRPSTLEQRLSHAPVVVPDDNATRPSLKTDDRVSRQPPILADRIQPDDRSRITDQSRPPILARVATSVKPVTAVQDRTSAPPTRPAGYSSEPLLRDNPRAFRRSRSPPLSYRPQDHEYRAPPAREMSRERVDDRPAAYRPDTARKFDYARSDTVVVDPPARGVDTGASFRRYPPSVSDDTGRDRGRNFYPPPSPRGDAPYGTNTDRRYPASEQRAWQSPSLYEGRDWNDDNFDPYWKRWDRSDQVDRERYDRLTGPPTPPRDWGSERPRAAFPPASPARSLDGAQRRSLGSRLTDPYPARDFDRARYPPPPVESSAPAPAPPPYVRGRKRSLSPIPRPPPQVVEHRPPIKRLRDDNSAYPAYHTSPPATGKTAVARGPSDYPPTRRTPPSPASTARFYDKPTPPLSGSSTGPQEREFTRDRIPEMNKYGMSSSYYRSQAPSQAPRVASRSPPSRMPPPQNYDRGPYERIGDVREDRRYSIPPPRVG